jgi:thiol-disulfide isomerase/thioredoxin
MKIIGVIGLALLGLISGTCMADAPPDTLTLADLVNHPDRWPATVTIGRDFQFQNGAVVHAGDKAQVKRFDGTHVGLAVGKIQFLANPEDVGFLDAANQAWAALTPVQRAVDATSLQADMTLWPVQVAVTQDITSQFGRLAAGTQVSLLNLSKQGALIAWPNSPNRINLDCNMTDVVNRARQLVPVDPSQRPSRVAAALENIMVDSDGKPYHDANLNDKKYFALYFGAGWCPPCQQFSPALVAYANKTLPQHPELMMVMLSDEHQPADMFPYMKSENMPFPAVPVTQLRQSYILTNFAADTPMIPHVVIVDRFGKVLAANADGQGNLTDATDTLAQLDKLLNALPMSQ